MEKVVLNETSLKSKAIKLFKNPKESKIKTFAIWTGENPDIEKLSPAENKEQNQKLKNELKTSRSTEEAVQWMQYPYYKIKGYYSDNTEHSFLIFNISLHEAKHLAGLCHQESFIFGVNKGEELVFEFWQNNGNYDYIKTDSKNCFNDDDLDKDFTKISKEFKFSIPFSSFAKGAEAMSEHYKNRGFSETVLEQIIEELVAGEANRKYLQALKYKLYSPNWKNFY